MLPLNFGDLVVKIKLNVYRLCWFCVLQAAIACVVVGIQGGALSV
jgi:hypothetical protein